VLLNGELWRARAQEPLALDDEVVVEAVQGLLLTVARAPTAGRTQSES
jgi:membrane protein implicated in regulation of membrane protease activity